MSRSTLCEVDVYTDIVTGSRLTLAVGHKRNGERAIIKLDHLLVNAVQMFAHDRKVA